MSQTLDPTLAKELGHTPNQDSVVNNQKDVDNNKNNSYTNNDSGQQSDSAGELPDEKFQRILKDTFGGDATKAVKSWIEAQSKYADTSREYKRIKGEYENFNHLLETNPTLFDIVKRASQGENIENLLSQSKEPSGKPKVSDHAFELDGSTSVDEKKLIESGYLDKSKLESMDDFSRQMAILNATQRYMFTEIPKQVTQRTQAELQKARQEELAKIQRETTQQSNLRRWQEGIKNAASKGWDFTGEHEALLDELEAEVNGVRDTKNLNLISEDAVDIALERIARRNGIKIKNTNPTQQLNLPQGQKNMQQTNMNSRGAQGEIQPEDFHHRLVLAQQKLNQQTSTDYLSRYKQGNK
jgi:hypothetical protein